LLIAEDLPRKYQRLRLCASVSQPTHHEQFVQAFFASLWFHRSHKLIERKGTTKSTKQNTKVTDTLLILVSPHYLLFCDFCVLLCAFCGQPGFLSMRSNFALNTSAPRL
jgi:hypothetical protein